MGVPLQGGARPVISWFIIPITIDITPLINPSYSTYKPTLNANDLGHHLVVPSSISNDGIFPFTKDNQLSGSAMMDQSCAISGLSVAWS